MRIPANLSNVIAAWLLSVSADSAMAAGKLAIEQSWIRAAPPGAMMLAGYAVLHNTGDEQLTVTGASSTDFAEVSLHESVAENGVERMRPLGDVSMAPGASVAFIPGGKHFMLMRPKRKLDAGAVVEVHISTASGEGTTAKFRVEEESPPAFLRASKPQPVR